MSIRSTAIPYVVMSLSVFRSLELLYNDNSFFSISLCRATKMIILAQNMDKMFNSKIARKEV